MREAAGESGYFPTNGEDWRMLVLGYRGTLEPEPGPECVHEGASGRSADEFGDFGAAPPEMEALTEPWLAKAQRELERRVPEGQRIFNGEQIPLEGLLKGLQRRLEEILTLTLAAALEGADAGRALRESDVAGRFPGLERLLRQAVTEWVTAVVTFCRRLQRDGQRLAEWMGVPSLGPVESVSGTAADTHPGGHAVLRVEFEGGCCIYYKPRGVTGEWLWHKLLEAIAEEEPALQLPAGRVLKGGVRGRYGWMESVRPEDLVRCGREVSADGAAYWRAAGAMLCLAYHVALTDLHLGNLLATPRGPVVTDAECLGTPGELNPLIWGHSADEAVSRKFLRLLQETGLLPGRVDGDMPDISGLFGSSGPVSTLKLPRWRREPDGAYRLTLVRAFLREHGNAPGDSRPLAVMPELLTGYREAANALLRVRRALVAPGARWRCVLEHGHAPRIVVRDTLTYGLLLSESLDPGRLGAGYSRRVTLLRALEQDGPGGGAASIQRVELGTLLQLHVPRLVMLPGTRTLASHSGRSLARNFARCTPGEEVVHRMEELTAERVEAVQVPALLLALLRA